MSCFVSVKPILVIVLGLSFCVAIENIGELQLDEQRRLKNNVLLYTDNSECAEKVTAAWRVGNAYTDARQVEAMAQNLATQFAVNESDTTCVAVCLQQGTPDDLLIYPLPQYLYVGGRDLNKVINNCKAAELGIISYDPRTNLNLYWINVKTGESVFLDTLVQGERNMKWHKTYLGHKFEIREGDVVLKAFTVQFDGIIVQGDPGHGLLPEPVPEKNIEWAMRNEWSRCNRVKRTFTELGFSRGRLPNDVWGSISAYNYNNKANAAREEWDSKGYFVNWWDVTPYLLGMPWNLKRVWQNRLKDMVEAWIGGIPLENTDIYGIRRYEDGARLLTHVDREATHAASMIINVEQVDMREDWMVEIYDFAGRLHEIPMKPGDIVYYESARCLHGRMKPLRGKSYSNLFTHYRPAGDPEWYLKENPPGTPEQLHEIGSCTAHSEAMGDIGMDCDKAGSLPFLSQSGSTVSGPDDLFKYWKKVSPSPEEVAAVHAKYGR